MAVEWQAMNGQNGMMMWLGNLLKSCSSSNGIPRKLVHPFAMLGAQAMVQKQLVYTNKRSDGFVWDLHMPDVAQMQCQDRSERHDFHRIIY